MERKSTAGCILPSGPSSICVTSAMYSHAPMLSNGGTEYVGRSGVLSFGSSPHPVCAGPTTAPCFLAHLYEFRQSVGQCLFESPPGYISSLSRSRHTCPELCEPKPEISMS